MDPIEQPDFHVPIEDLPSGDFDFEYSDRRLPTAQEEIFANKHYLVEMNEIADFLIQEWTQNPTPSPALLNEIQGDIDVAKRSINKIRRSAKRKGYSEVVEFADIILLKLRHLLLEINADRTETEAERIEKSLVDLPDRPELETVEIQV